MIYGSACASDGRRKARFAETGTSPSWFRTHHEGKREPSLQQEVPSVRLLKLKRISTRWRPSPSRPPDHALLGVLCALCGAIGFLGEREESAAQASPAVLPSPRDVHGSSTCGRICSISDSHPLEFLPAARNSTAAYGASTMASIPMECPSPYMIGSMRSWSISPLQVG